MLHLDILKVDRYIPPIPSFIHPPTPENSPPHLTHLRALTTSLLVLLPLLSTWVSFSLLCPRTWRQGSILFINPAEIQHKWKYLLCPRELTVFPVRETRVYLYNANSHENDQIFLRFGWVKNVAILLTQWKKLYGISLLRKSLIFTSFMFPTYPFPIIFPTYQN